MAEDKLNPKMAQYLSEDEKSYRVFHPNLGEFSVAKSGLNKKTHSFISSLKEPKGYWNGGGPGVDSSSGTKKEDSASFLAGLGPKIGETLLASAQTPQQDVASLSPYSTDGAASFAPQEFAPAQKAPVLSDIQNYYNTELKAHGFGDDYMVTPGGPAPKKIDPVSLAAAYNLTQGKKARLEEQAKQPQKANAQQIRGMQEQVLGLAPPPQNKDAAPEDAAPKKEDANVNVPAQVGPPVPSDEQRMSDLFTNVESAAKDAATAEAKATLAGAAQLNAAANRLDEIQRKTDEFRQQWQKKYSTLEEQYRKGEINPNKVWQNMGTGNKIMAGIAMALGGIGQGLSKGGPNYAVDIINKVIDQDIESQKENLGKQKGILSMYMDELKDFDSAQMAAQNHYLTAAKTRVEAAMSMARLPQQQLALQNTLLELDRKRQENNAKLAERKALKSLTGGDAQGGNINALPKEVQDRLVRIPDASGVRYSVAVTPEAAKETQKKIIAIDNAKTSLMKLYQSPTGGHIPFTKKGTDEYEKADIVRGNVILALKDAYDLGDKPEAMKRLESMVPEVYQWDKKESQMKIAQIIQNLKDMQDATLQGNTVGFKKAATLQKGLAK